MFDISAQVPHEGIEWLAAADAAHALNRLQESSKSANDE